MEAPAAVAEPNRWAAPRLQIESGTLEALKWLGLALMLADHVNKYLLHDSQPALFAAGRLALPIFSFVLAYNLARPRHENGMYLRVAGRMALAGTIASVPFIGLGGLAWEWWPLNVMFTLLVATGILALLEQSGPARLVGAAILFFFGGALVEFWWPALVMTLAAWRYARRPGWTALAVWIGATASLYVINRSLWALAALPLIFAAPHVAIGMPRVRHAFYVFYPLHLWVLWIFSRV